MPRSTNAVLGLRTKSITKNNRDFIFQIRIISSRFSVIISNDVRGLQTAQMAADSQGKENGWRALF